jgi:hypothetical protein
MNLDQASFFEAASWPLQQNKFLLWLTEWTRRPMT